jgi:hypothetical protein
VGRVPRSSTRPGPAASREGCAASPGPDADDPGVRGGPRTPAARRASTRRWRSRRTPTTPPRAAAPAAPGADPRRPRGAAASVTSAPQALKHTTKLTSENCFHNKFQAAKIRDQQLLLFCCIKKYI